MLQIKGMVLGLGGDLGGSIDLYRRALAMAKEQDDCPTILGVSTILAKSLAAIGEREEARACLSFAPPELVRYLQKDGRRKVLWGSNFPMILPHKALEDIDSLGLDAEARGMFLSGNAQRVFGL